MYGSEAAVVDWLSGYWMLARSAKFIILNTKSLVFDTQFLVFDTNSSFLLTPAEVSAEPLSVVKPQRQREGS